MSKSSERFYRLLLRLYPADHRHEYGEMMVQNFRDMQRDVAKNGRWLDGLMFWLHILTDTAVSAFVEHRDAMKEGRFMATRQGLMPLLAVIGLVAYLQLFHYGIGTGAVYVILLITGGIGWGLSHLGLMLYHSLWRAYTLGALLGFLSLFMMILGGGISTWVNQFPAIVVAGLSVGLYIAGMVVLSYWLKPSNKVFYSAAVALPLVSILLLNLVTLPPDMGDRWSAISVTFVLTHAFTGLLVCAICLHLMRHRGEMGVIVLMVALGAQYVFIDPAYFMGGAAFWIDFVVLLCPLVICPLWWLTAPTAQAKHRGTFALWVGFALFGALMPFVARQFLSVSDDGQLLLMMSRLMITLPHLIAMWIILRAARDTPHLPFSSRMSTVQPDFRVSDAAKR